MELNEYQKHVKRTLLVDPPDLDFSSRALLQKTLACAQVFGRTVERIKKGLFHGRDLDRGGTYDDLDNVSRVDGRDITVDGHLIKILCILGLIGEACELIELLDKGTPAMWADELGDNGFYWAALTGEVGLLLEDVAQGNVDKLRGRYPDGFTTENSTSQGSSAGGGC